MGPGPGLGARLQLGPFGDVPPYIFVLGILGGGGHVPARAPSSLEVEAAVPAPPVKDAKQDSLRFHDPWFLLSFAGKAFFVTVDRARRE